MCVCVRVVCTHYFHGVVPLLELGGEDMWEEALVGPPLLPATPPPVAVDARLLARELGSSVEVRDR